MADPCNYNSILATAFFSDTGAEGETDPCLVIDAQGKFYAWLVSCLDNPVLESFELSISGLSILFETGAKYRTCIENGKYKIVIPSAHRSELAKIIKPHADLEQEPIEISKARRVHVFFDIADGFEVVLRKLIAP